MPCLRKVSLPGSAPPGHLPPAAAKNRTPRNWGARYIAANAPSGTGPVTVFAKRAKTAPGPGRSSLRPRPGFPSRLAAGTLENRPQIRLTGYFITIAPAGRKGKILGQIGKGPSIKRDGRAPLWKKIKKNKINIILNRLIVLIILSL